MAAALMPDFEDDHLSGRFTATPEEEAVAIDAILKTADLFSTTEISAWARSRALVKPGFHAVYGNKGPRDDTGIAVRLARFDVQESGTKTLSPLTYITERGERSDTTKGAYVVVHDKRTRLTGVKVAVHMPHGMQDALRKGRIGDDVAKAYRDILRGARRLANGLARTHKADWTEIVGDFNLDVKHAWVRLYLKAQFPHYRVNWTKPYPRAGTFGHSIIDLALLRGIKPTSGPRITRQKRGFDHVGWSQRLGR